MAIDQNLKQLEIFSGLESSDLDLLTQHTELHNFKRGSFIYKTGDEASYVYLMNVGSVKLIKSHPDGKERIIHILLRGEVFGAMVVMNKGFYPVSAVGLEEGSCLKIAASVFRQIFLNHPKIGQKLMLQISQRMQMAHDDRLFTIDSVEKRIAFFLLDLLERIQKIYGQTSRINLPLTKQDIADKVASTVETVIRIMGQWSRQNLVLIKDRYIEIPDISLLKNIAGFEV
ncbi:MAG: transcriptional regulator [uncultured bacterium]|nr:MAG: transcriptional regulator [uncultured bacterium]